MPIRPVSELVAEAKARIETMSQDEVQRLSDLGEILLVDIRDPRELKREGKIPGAFHAPRGMLEFWIDPESPYYKESLATDRKIVLFCAGAQRSSLAARTLKDMGLENVAEMEGGFGAWKKAGRPVEEP